MQKSLWISDKILNYEKQGLPAFRDYQAQLELSYRILDDIENVLSKDKLSDYDLTSAVLQLHRVIEFRDRELSKIYKWKELKKLHKYKNLNEHELMHDLGLIKNNTKNEIFELRRKVAHFLGDPPEPALLRKWHEICWFYLRATDPFVTQLIYMFNLETTHDENGVEIFIPDKDGFIEKWSFEIRGSLPLDFLKYEKCDGFLEVILANDPIPNTRDPNFICFTGSFKDECYIKEKLVKLFFKCI